MRILIPAFFTILASPAQADSFEFYSDFSGQVAIGVTGGTVNGESYVSPYIGFEAEAEFTMEFGTGSTIRIILPLEAEAFSAPNRNDPFTVNY